MSAQTGPINVLSIDGGGIRGIIPASILEALEQCIGRELHQVFDLIAGTSTGGIIALGIGTTANGGKPYRPEDLVGLYVANGPSIFKKDLLTPLKSFFGPKYAPDALEKVLSIFFGETELRSALTPLLISSYDLQRQVPFFFKSHRIAEDPTYNWKVREIARATSAAPTFFPPLHLRGSSTIRQWRHTRRHGTCIPTRANLSSCQLEPEIAMTRSPITRQKAGDSSAGPDKSFQ